MFRNTYKVKMSSLYVIILLITSIFGVNCRQEWIDPFDMNVENYGAFSTKNEDRQNEMQNFCPKPINHAIAHFKRAINLLLSAVAIDRSDMASYKGLLSINIPMNTYDYLRDFARNADEDPATLRKIDDMLSKILVKPIHEKFIDSFLSWTDHIYFTFYNRTTGILLACLFVVFISYKLLRANLTIWSVVKYLIFLGWLIDFAFTWVNLLQEAEINKMADSLRFHSIPVECDPSKMSMWQYIWNSLGSKNECRQYHHVKYKDHMWSIAPVTVFSHQIGVVILTPAAHIGQAVGSFTSGVLDKLPWGLNYLFLPVLLVFAAIILCIILSFLTNTSFGFNFMHLFQLNFGSKEMKFIDDSLTGSNLNKLLNIAQNSTTEPNRVQIVTAEIRRERDNTLKPVKKNRNSEKLFDGKTKMILETLNHQKSDLKRCNSVDTIHKGGGFWQRRRLSKLARGAENTQ